MQPQLGQIVVYAFKNTVGDLVCRPAIVTSVAPADVRIPGTVSLTVFFALGDQQNNVMLGFPTAVSQSDEPVEGCWTHARASGDLSFVRGTKSDSVHTKHPRPSKK